MGYEEYRQEFLTELRNDSAINGSDTEDEFINRTLDVLSEFDEIEDPVEEPEGGDFEPETDETGEEN